MEQIQVHQDGTDGISSVSFSPHASNLILASYWDSSVRLYDIFENRLKTEYRHGGAVLDACFSDPAHAFSGGLDNTLKMYDFTTQNETVLGTHEDAIKCVCYSQDLGCILTGGWDKSLKLWDYRSPKPLLGTYEQPGKVFTMDVVQRRVVLGTSGRHVHIFDVRNLGDTLQKRESSLKYQTRAIRCFPNAEGYALSSIEGRVAVEYFDPSPEVQAKKYAFKCHRTREDTTEVIHPVNAIAFHPLHGTFATGGCDGMVYIWDGSNKKRLKQYPRYPSSISSLAFSHDGKYLAVASSYTYEEGEKDHEPDAIFVRPLAENETKSKTAA